MDAFRIVEHASPVKIRRLLVEPPLRPFTAFGYRAAVETELALARRLDRLEPVPADASGLLADVAAVVKTFERPRILGRLVESIRRLYPELDIVVVDDSVRPSALPGVRTVTLPYDSGIAAGRNEGLKHVQTRYVLVLDDDFIFFRGTRLEPALRTMEANPEIDIMGGQLIDLPMVRRRQPPRGQIMATAAKPVRPLGSLLGGLEVVDKVSQFFLARRDRVALVGWDPRLKRLDHADFFTRALGVLTTVFNPDLKCLHARTPFDDAYMSKRLDLSESFRAVDERYRT